MAGKRTRGKLGLGIGQPPVAQFGKTPTDYAKLSEGLKNHSAQTRAGLAVNRELIGLYWHVGKPIVDRQRSEGWGKTVIERLAADIRRAFLAVSGFSAARAF